MANSSDIIKIGFDYRASLAQFEKETNGVFDGISEKAGKQKIIIQLDAKNDKVIEKIKELQKLKLDKFTFEFGDSGIKEQLKTFGQLENKINEIINLSKGIGSNSSPIIDVKDSTAQIDKLQNKLDELTKKYDELSSKKIDAAVSGKDINLVDNEEFKRLSDEFSLLKDELSNLKREMQLFEEATVSADTFVAMERNVNGLIVKVDDLIDKYIQLSVVQKNIGTDKSNILSKNIDNKTLLNNNRLVDDIGHSYSDLLYKINLENDAIKEGNKFLGERIVLLKNNTIIDGYLGERKHVDGDFGSQNGDKIVHTHSDDISGESLSSSDMRNFVNNYLNNKVTEFELIWKNQILNIKLPNNLSENDLSYLSNSYEALYNAVVAQLGRGLETVPENVATSFGKYVNSFLENILSNIGGSLTLSQIDVDGIIKQIELPNLNKEEYESIYTTLIRIKDIDFSNDYTKQIQDILSATRPLVETVDTLYESLSYLYNLNNKSNISTNIKQIMPFLKNDDVKYLSNILYDNLTDIDLKMLSESVYNQLYVPFKQAREEALSVINVIQEIGKLSNTTFPIKDAFQDGDKSGAEASTSAIKEESQALEQVSGSAKEAANSKERFSEANKEVKTSAESSSVSLGEEKKKIESVGDSAEETKKKLDDVVFKPNTEGFDEIVSKLDIAKERIEEISKITKSSVWSESEGKYLESYNIRYKNGTSEIRGENSNKNGSNVLRANEVAYDAKAADQEAKALSKAWEEAVKFNSELDKALENTKNLVSTLSQPQELQGQFSTLNNDIEKLNGELKTGEISISEYNKSVKSLTSEYSKLVTIQQNRDVEVYKQNAKAAEQVEDLSESLKTYKDKLSVMSYKPDAEHRFPEYQALLNKINVAITDYENHINSLKGKGIINKSDIDKANELEDIIKSLLNKTKKFSSGDKGFENVSASKIAEQINKLLKDNSAMSKEAKAQIRAYYNEVVSGNPTRPLKEIYNDALKVVQAEREMGRAGKSFLETIKDKAWYGWAAQLAGTFGVYDIVNVGRQGFEAIRELDTALVDLKKTTAMNSSQLEEFYYDSNDVAKQMGVTTQAIIDQASAWSRLGFNTKEQSTQMAELSSQFATISPDMDLDIATDGLVSSMKAFDIEVTNVERDIMDNINRIGNTAATSNGEIVDMLTRSSAAMAAANNTIQETIALETAAVEITRNAETTGTAFKTLSMRIRGRQTLPPYTVMYMLCA